MRALGIKGFGDSENWARVVNEAMGDFDQLATFIHAGLSPAPPLEEVQEAVLDWTHDDIRTFLGLEGGDTNPPRAGSESGSTGAASPPSPGTISA
jgi:hypothetical protein